MQSKPEVKTSDTRRPEEPGIAEIKKQFDALPTGKVNISFSELRVWQECSFRHKLQHIDKIDLGEPSQYLDFGTSVHAAHEKFIQTGTMDTSVATDMMAELWEKNKHAYSLDKACNEAVVALNEIPAFYDKTFPNWKAIAAEQLLFEKIEDEPHAFKGFIDAIIQVPSKGKRDPLIWILDLKSTSWGWDRRKKTDKAVQSQLVLYKNFWAQKTNHDLKQIRAGFVLLKRSAKPGQHCELVTVSIGEKPIRRSLEVVNDMLFAVKKGVAFKNRHSCTYCEFKDTEWCP